METFLNCSFRAVLDCREEAAFLDFVLCVFEQVKYAQHGGFKEEDSEDCGKLQQTQGNQPQFLVESQWNCPRVKRQL